MTFATGTPICNGRFIIESLLGEGGMGYVYKARDTKLRRTVALKWLRPNLIESAAVLARFKGEGELAAQIEHPNVVRIYETFEEEGIPFIAMEYVDGLPATAFDAFPASEALRTTEEVLYGLIEAHAMGIIHRDIKPANILIRRKTGTPLIADFGIARFEEFGSGYTRAGTGQGVGTPGYMAPEQSGDATNIDLRVDIFALAATLHTLRTGHVHIKSFALTMEEDHTLFDGLEPELVEIIRMGTANRMLRFQTAQAMLERVKLARTKVPTADPAVVEKIYADAFARAAHGTLAEAIGVPSPVIDPVSQRTLTPPADFVPNPPVEQAHQTASPSTNGDTPPQRWPLAVIATGVLGLIIGGIGWTIMDRKDPVVERAPQAEAIEVTQPVAEKAKTIAATSPAPAVEVTLPETVKPTPPVVTPPSKPEAKAEVKAKAQPKPELKAEPVPVPSTTPQELAINHTPVTSIGGDRVTFTATVQGENPTVTLFYRAKGKMGYASTEMTNASAGKSHADLRITPDIVNGFEYYIEAKSGNEKKTSGTFLKPYSVDARPQ